MAHNAVAGQPCLICGKVFENSYKAIKHLLTHVPGEPNLIKLFNCFLVWANVNEYMFMKMMYLIRRTKF